MNSVGTVCSEALSFQYVKHYLLVQSTAALTAQLDYIYGRAHAMHMPLWIPLQIKLHNFNGTK